MLQHAEMMEYVQENLACGFQEEKSTGFLKESETFL